MVLPIRIAPAARSRETTVASASATAPARSGSPMTSGQPATETVSLTVNGTPDNGPGKGSRAAASAPSASRNVKALTSAEMRSRCAETTSTAETSRAAIAAARSVADAKGTARP